MSTPSVTERPDADPLGHALLRERLRSIPAALAGLAAQGLPPLPPATAASQRFLITGTGSSEAHARYLCGLLNLHTERAACFLPLSGFTEALRPSFRGRTLVVISQGISPNAQVALRFRDAFAHTVLFTATTPATAHAAGKPDRAALLERLAAEGAERVEFPLAEEYRTLIRFVGPLAGYLAVWLFAARFPEARLEAALLRDLPDALQCIAPAALHEAVRDRRHEFTHGFNLVTAAPIADYAQNLACKFMEGLFWPCPAISDFLQFAHGPFQQATAHPHAVVLLRGSSLAEQELVRRSHHLLRGAGLPAYEIAVDLPPQLAIFGFEAAFNDLVFAQMQREGSDQLNWPGKGRDDALYGFCGDESSP